MDVVQRFDRLYLDNYAFLNQEVGDKIPDQDILVTNFNPVLLGNLKVCPLEFNSERIFIDLFKKSSTEDVAYLMNAANDLFRNLIQSRSAFIGVHRRLNSGVHTPRFLFRFSRRLLFYRA